ncbi:hypothetical protein OV079_00795 [Nannocystis pusilla]|uniref:Uncharacterized protein n=1 Tax=Nannocystis pusilla TaxID=889268 RepID=A0A9X3EI54_9BACT|nr:hypothetical protein [Nannocystis pusilla]MCY1004126.1 hypothetical protein [Nannocystis pusilla]
MNYTTIALSSLLCTIPYLQDFHCDVDPQDDHDDDDDDDDDDGDELYWAEGPQMDVPGDALVGWSECFANLYGEHEPDLSTEVLGQQCTGSKLLMACRPVGAADFQLLAMGERADVLFDVGSQVDGKHEANGVAWYFSNNFSWGFAAAGDTVNRIECDEDFFNPQTNPSSGCVGTPSGTPWTPAIAAAPTRGSTGRWTSSG